MKLVPRRRTCLLPLLAAAFIVSLLSAGPALAGNGGKKPGGDTTDGSGYSIVPLMPSDVPIWESWVGDLNEFGSAVGGYEELDGARRAFYYDSTTEIFKTLAGGTSASGVNDAGEVVGGDGTIWHAPIGLYWRHDGALPQVVSSLPGDVGAAPADVNDAGIICGLSLAPLHSNGEQHEAHNAAAWLIDSSGNVSMPMQLPPLPGDSDASASRLNELDESGLAQVVGFSSLRVEVIGSNGVVYLDTVSTTAVVWTVQLADGTLALVAGPTDLGSLAGGDSLATAANFYGDICGHSDKWPFVKPAGAAMIPLSGLKGADQGDAFDINDAGHVVGSQRVLGKRGDVFNQLAVLWVGGEAMDLNTQNRGATGWDKLEYALDINETGYITGEGVNADFGSGSGAFLMIPK